MIYVYITYIYICTPIHISLTYTIEMYADHKLTSKVVILNANRSG